MPKVTPSIVVQFLVDSFPALKERHTGWQLEQAHAEALGAVLALVDELQDEHFVLIPPTDYAAFTAAIGAVRSAMAGWRTGAHPGLQNKLGDLPGLGRRHPLVILRDVLEQCPDEVPHSRAAEIRFIKEPLATSLRLDMSTAYSAHANGGYKAAAVMAGSVIEAILLWAIQREDKPSVQTAHANWAANRVQGSARKSWRDPVNWTLDEYAGIAFELGLITELLSSAILLAKHYRNLIHPGKEQRLSETNTRGTATLTIGAMERLVEHFTARYRELPPV